MLLSVLVLHCSNKTL